jgi:hypothetical protein
VREQASTPRHTAPIHPLVGIREIPQIARADIIDKSASLFVKRAARKDPNASAKASKIGHYAIRN